MDLKEWGKVVDRSVERFKERRMDLHAHFLQHNRLYRELVEQADLRKRMSSDSSKTTCSENSKSTSKPIRRSLEMRAKKKRTGPSSSNP